MANKEVPILISITHDPRVLGITRKSLRSKIRALDFSISELKRVRKHYRQQLTAAENKIKELKAKRALKVIAK